MKYIIAVIGILFSIHSVSYSQNYSSYFTGNTTDTATTPQGGVCLMGGATENDNAMTWFLQKANGGDILVLRASGSDGYNNYLYSGLGVNVNSVETIVFNNAAASFDPYVWQKIQQAEAIWIAGGDQWDYISYWRNSPVDSLLNDAISNRNIVIGGTSAGMAILGDFYFSAENGTVTSNTTLNNPYNSNVTVDSIPFITNPYLQDVITDTHYDNPDRKGRHVVFLSRILLDFGVEAKGIACDEYTAVCIESNGLASVYGDYPGFDDNAYFIQTNCELTINEPENCAPNIPLTWNRGNEALKVYKIKGTSNGNNSFNLNDWKTGSGGVWENWYVDNGILNEAGGLEPNCALNLSINLDAHQCNDLYPNPCIDMFTVEVLDSEILLSEVNILNQQGELLRTIDASNSEILQVPTSNLSSGVYIVEIIDLNGSKNTHKIVVN